MVRSTLLEVQSDLADGNGFVPGAGNQGVQLCQVVQRRIGAVLRVDSNGCENAGFLLCKANREVRRDKVDAWTDDQAEAGVPASLQDILPVAVELGHLDMRMRIDICRFFAQWISAPSGRTVIGVRRAISSPTEAARSMPCDTMPLSLRGWRFATITICLPTRAAGS